MNRSAALLIAALFGAGASGHFRIEAILLAYAGLEFVAALATGRLKARTLPRVALFLADFAWDIVHSNVTMAFDAIIPRDWHHVRLVRVPIGDMSEGEIALLNHRINLAPGTLVCRIDPDRQNLYVHDMYGREDMERAAELRRPVDMLREKASKK